MQGVVFDLGVRVTGTEKDLAGVKDTVQRQGDDLDNVKNDVSEQGQRLGQVEDTVDDTVAKVQEIDGKVGEWFQLANFCILFSKSVETGESS